MAEMQLHQVWLRRALFIGLAGMLLLLPLIPLETVPPSLGGVSVELADQPIPALLPDGDGAGTDHTDLVDDAADPARWIAPDLLILLTLAWVTRRPGFAPALAIAAIFLVADLLFQRPPGLWAGLVLILSEMLRGRSRSLRTLPFWVEWATVGGGLIAITLVNRFTLSMVLVPQASLGLTLLQMALTILCYPVVVLLSYLLFGISRPTPGEVDASGKRL